MEQIHKRDITGTAQMEKVNNMPREALRKIPKKLKKH